MIELARQAPKAKHGLVLLAVIAVILFTQGAILLGVPFLRQVLGFLSYGILPGLLVVLALRLHRLAGTEKVVLSAGISIVFLAMAGLAIDGLFLGIGYATPLATVPLSVALTIILLGLCLVAYKVNRNAFSVAISPLGLGPTGRNLLMLALVFPALSIAGARLLDLTGDNTLLLVFLALVAAYCVLVSILGPRTSPTIYPLAIFFTGVSLLLMYSFRSSHLLGQDIHVEYLTLQQTMATLRFGISEGYLESLLSVTLLPTMFHSLLGISGEHVFKFLYPLLFSIAPLSLYVFSKRYVGERYAFIAAFFLMAQTKFFLQTDVRSPMAIVIIALATVILFHDQIAGAAKSGLFLAAFVTVIWFNYTNSFQFVAFLIIGWAVAGIALRRTPTRQRRITATACLFGAAFFFFWYGQLFLQPFDSVVFVLSDSVRRLKDIFSFETGRSEIITATLTGSGGIAQKAQLLVLYLSIAFIAVGLLASAWSYWAGRRGSHTGAPDRSSGQARIEPEYLVLGISFFLTLVLWAAAPYASLRYDIGRLYMSSLVFLAIFFVLGGISLARKLRLHPCLPLLMLLVPYFAFASGLAYSLWGVPKYVHLESRGDNYDRIYVYDGEWRSVIWLDQHAAENKLIYSGVSGSDERLVERIPYRRLRLLAPDMKEVDGYIYLRYYNLTSGKMDGPGYIWYDMKENAAIFARKARIYSNGYSEIYR